MHKNIFLAQTHTSLLISVMSTSRNCRAGFIHLASRHSYKQHHTRLTTNTHSHHDNTPASMLKSTEWLRERTKHLDTFLFSTHHSNGVLFSMFCLLVEGECQFLLF